MNIFEEIPLPYDDELKDEMEQEREQVESDAEQVYNQAMNSGYFKKDLFNVKHS